MTVGFVLLLGLSFGFRIPHLTSMTLRHSMAADSIACVGGGGACKTLFTAQSFLSLNSQKVRVLFRGQPSSVGLRHCRIEMNLGGQAPVLGLTTGGPPNSTGQAKVSSAVGIWMANGALQCNSMHISGGATTWRGSHGVFPLHAIPTRLL